MSHPEPMGASSPSGGASGAESPTARASRSAARLGANFPCRNRNSSDGEIARRSAGVVSTTSSPISPARPTTPVSSAADAGRNRVSVRVPAPLAAALRAEPALAADEQRLDVPVEQVLRHAASRDLGGGLL